jgi:phage/plasmid-like protein (TIGR03299 family)
MPADVDSMVYTGETPWHGLGLRMDHLMTVDEAYDLTMNWKVREQGLYVANPDTGASIRVPGYKAIVRAGDNEVLAVMGENYKVFQNDDHAEFLKRVIGRNGEVGGVEAAGVLGRGRKVWILCRLNDAIRVPDSKDDVVEEYLLSYTSHDGSVAHTLLPLSIRTLNQSTLEAGPGIKVRHTARMEGKVREAQRTLDEVLGHFQGLRKEIRAMTRARFTQAHMRDLAAHLFPPTRVQKDGVLLDDTQHVSQRTEEARDKLTHLFEHGHGQETCRGTAWAAMNAVTEFCDHYRMTRVTGNTERDERSVREARLQSIWFGASRDMKDQARRYIHSKID